MNLRLSLRSPHPESEELAEVDFTEWAQRLPEGDEQMLDLRAGRSVRWIPGRECFAVE
jgi:hypothetical protein